MDDRKTKPEKNVVQTTLYLDADLFDRYQSVFQALRQKRRGEGTRGRVRVHDLYVRALEEKISEFERELGLRSREAPDK